MAIWNLRARVAILWLVLTLLVVGVVAWAISAEVVMGAMRDAVRKNSDSSTLRLHQNFDNSDDFSIHRINNKVGHSKKSGLSHSERALIREVDRQPDPTNKVKSSQKSVDDFYSYDQRSDETYSSQGDEESEQLEEALESIGVIKKKVLTTKKPVSINLDLDKLRKSLTGEQVAQVLNRLMSQTKNKEGKSSQTVATQTSSVMNRKSKTNKTSPKLSTKSQKYSKPKTTSTTTTTTTTTPKPSTSRTTFKPFNRSRIQSLSLRLSNSAITTTKPKRTKLKVSTIKFRRPTTSTTTPSTTTFIPKMTTKKITLHKSRIRSRKPSLKPIKSISSKYTTTSTTTESSKASFVSEMEALKSKIRQKDLEFILNKVESLEKQQKRFLKNSNQDLLMESSFRDTVVKPKYEVISFRQKQPDYSPNYSSRHNYDIQDMKHHNREQMRGWQPSPVYTPPSIHLPPPPPPPPPIPNGPPQPVHHPPPPPPSNVYHNPDIGPHQSHIEPHPPPHSTLPQQYIEPHPPPHSGPPQQYIEPHPPPHSAPPQQYIEPQRIPQYSGNPIPEPNMNHNINNGHIKENLFNGVMPIPNRAINMGGSGGGEPQMAQESHPMEYQIKQRGHVIQKSEKPGVQLSFGGGPMGGGGQLKTSPMGIFKTLLLPLLPKPRMNLNGKVVFGVVLENGVGFGKKPKIVAQHFSTGHI